MNNLYNSSTTSLRPSKELFVRHEVVAEQINKKRVHQPDSAITVPLDPLNGHKDQSYKLICHDFKLSGFRLVAEQQTSHFAFGEHVCVRRCRFTDVHEARPNSPIAIIRVERMYPVFNLVGLGSRCRIAFRTVSVTLS